MRGSLSCHPLLAVGSQRLAPVPQLRRLWSRRGEQAIARPASFRGILRARDWRKIGLHSGKLKDRSGELEPSALAGIGDVVEAVIGSLNKLDDSLGKVPAI